MNRTHEKLLVAALAGLIIAGAAAYTVPALASGYHVEAPAHVVHVQKWDVLNVRKWPASYSQKVGSLKPNAKVWVERCVTKDAGADWCLVKRGDLSGWVNARYIAPAYDY